MRKLFTLISLVVACAGNACTNLIVGKNASTDGSVMITYSQDSYGSFGWLHHFPAGTHAEGEVQECYDYETLNFLGTIPQAPVTYNVVGHINEHQLAITETTWGGREELWKTDSTAILDYGCLMWITLQRAKTAREAIDVMVNLANTYGYRSEGESITIADKEEAWIVDMIGKGKGRRGIVWVATRIPDDCIAAHANQARTRKFMGANAYAHGSKALEKARKSSKQIDVIYSPDVISIAREMGYFDGKDEDFDFADAYNPLDFGGARYCEARAWSFFNRFVDGMDRFLPYASGQDLKAEPFAMYYVPKRKLSLQDVRDAMRDHYEGTPFDTQTDCGAGIWNMPYRPTPLSFELDGKKYFNERPISTQQPQATMICQMRPWLPDAVGGIIWWGEDDANMIAYTPMFCSATEIPFCYTDRDADAITFSMKNAYWVCNWVANMVYPRYSMLFPELQAVRDQYETEMDALVASTPKDATPAQLTTVSCRAAEGMMDRWTKLAERIIVKYNDMAIKGEKDGRYILTPGGAVDKMERPGFPEQYKRTIVKETGDKYLIPQGN